MRRLPCLAPLLLLLSAALACGYDDVPAATCEQRIDDEGPWLEVLLSEPAILALNDALAAGPVHVNPCVNGGRVNYRLPYTTRPEASDYGVGYRFEVAVDYVQASQALEAELFDESVALEAEAILNQVTSTISQAESHPGLAEILATLRPSSGFLLGDRVYYEILGTVDNLSYSLAAGDLSLYRLPNEYDWPAFPEIAQVQAIVEQELLVDDLAGCFIRREGLHSATARRPLTSSAINRTLYRPFSSRVGSRRPSTLLTTGMELAAIRVDGASSSRRARLISYPLKWSSLAVPMRSIGIVMTASSAGLVRSAMGGVVSAATASKPLQS